MSAREVELSGGAPWGFRMHGGVDQNQPLRISRSLSDTHELTSKVNPGRKASLSGIREGDVITSINGKPTKDMSNSDAHAILRSAGPVLRLGLNEDREMSPRRRSIGKATELKRPSQLISEIDIDRATPQAPVYATIRPPQSPLNKLSQSPIRPLNSPQPTFNSTTLVKSVTSSEEPLKFHPTNPFYSTLPSNYSNSKLPLRNGKTIKTPLNSRSLNKSDSYSNYNDHDLKLSSFFLRKFDSGPNSIQNYDSEPKNLYEHTLPKYLPQDKYNTLSSSHIKATGLRKNNDISNNDSNPFGSSSRSEFKPYDQSNRNLNNGPSSNGPKTLFYSKSDGDFQTKEEVVKHSTVTEKKISQVEEIKTIKKVTLNGSSDHEHNHKNGILSSSEELSKYNSQNRVSQDLNKERLIPTLVVNYYHRNNPESGERKKQESVCTPTYQSARDNFKVEMNSPCFASSPYIFHPPSESSATETDDSVDSGCEKTVSGSVRTKYIDPKRRTINKVSKKILRAIERLTCNIKRNTKTRTSILKKSQTTIKGETLSDIVVSRPPIKSPSSSHNTSQAIKRE